MTRHVKITDAEQICNIYNHYVINSTATFEEEEIIDIDAVNAEITELKAQIAVVEAEMDKYLEELGLK